MLELAPFGDQAQLSRVDWREALPDLAAVWGPALKRSPDNACCNNNNNNNNNNNTCCLKTGLEEGSWQCLFAASKQETLLRQTLTDKKVFKEFTTIWRKSQMWYFRSMVTQSAEPLQNFKGICWNLSNCFIWINWDFTNSQRKERLSILEIEFSKYCLDPSDSTTVSNWFSVICFQIFMKSP